MSDTNPLRPEDAVPLLGRRFAHALSRCDACEVRDRSFCGVLEGHEFARLAAIVTSRSFDARQSIVHEGDEAEVLLNVISGTVKIYRALPDGRVQIVGFLSEGDFMGVPATRRYGVSAEAITPVEMCAFPRRSFDRLLNEFPTLERRLFELSTNEVAAARDHMLLLGRKTARERVASFLVAMADKPSCAHVSSPSVALPMTRAEIADYLGLTMETVSRTLTSLRNEGVIVSSPPDRLVLAQLEKLRQIAAGDV